jgi:FMN phosphatase YigB (HAD superfamily)
MEFSELPKLVVFDMAGTTLKDDGGVVMGIPKPVAIATLLGGSGSEEQNGAIYTSFLGRMKRFYETDPSVAEVPGTSLVFLKLRDARVRVALDTGFPREIAATILQRLNWGSLLDDSIASDEVACGRPHPDMIQVLRARAGIGSAKGIAKIGDTPADPAPGDGGGMWLGDRRDARLAHRRGAFAPPSHPSGPHRRLGSRAFRALIAPSPNRNGRVLALDRAPEDLVELFVGVGLFDKRVHEPGALCRTERAGC